MNLSVSVLMLVLVSFCSARVHFTNCGTNKSSLKNVTIGPCGTGSSCILKKGTDVTLKVTFEADSATKKAKAEVHGIIAGIPMPFHLPEDDGCKSGLKCPLQKGKTYDYEASIPIKTTYPSIGVIVKWELKDDSGKDLFCLKIPAHIQ